MLVFTKVNGISQGFLPTLWLVDDVTTFSNARNSDDKLRFVLFGHNSLAHQINKEMIDLVAEFISNVKHFPLIIPTRLGLDIW
jgi:extradiol dioxygenase family protein